MTKEEAIKILYEMEVKTAYSGELGGLAVNMAVEALRKLDMKELSIGEYRIPKGLVARISDGVLTVRESRQRLEVTEPDAGIASTLVVDMLQIATGQQPYALKSQKS